MLHVRRTHSNGCSCATKPGKGGERRDDYRTDKSCDICGPFVAAYNLARTKLDQALDKELRSAGFDPEAKADEHTANDMAQCKALGAGKELFTNV